MSLEAVQAVLFDVFGTVVDWHRSITRHLQAKAPFPEDWAAFAEEWRAGYMRVTHVVAAGGKGPATVDGINRLNLDQMLASPRWSKLGPFWNDAIRNDLVLAWHRLDPWPDTVAGLTALKHHRIIGSLSNGNIKLLVDMAKHANLPWDVILSSSLFNSYKPNPAIYKGAAYELSLPPDKVLFVAAHIADCNAARAYGFRTVYVPRPTEDLGVHVDTSTVDLVVSDFEELARVLPAPDPKVIAKL